MSLQSFTYIKESALATKQGWSTLGKLNIWSTLCFCGSHPCFKIEISGELFEKLMLRPHTPLFQLVIYIGLEWGTIKCI